MRRSLLGSGIRFVIGLCLGLGAPRVAGQVTMWQSELARIRQLAENDAPSAAAALLAMREPAGLSGADRVDWLILRAEIELALGEIASCRRIAGEAQQLARKVSDFAGEAKAEMLLARGGFLDGSYRETLASVERCLALLKGTGRTDLQIEALYLHTRVNHFLGKTDKGLETSVRMQELALQRGDARSLALAHLSLGSTFYRSERFQEALSENETALRHAREAGSRALEIKAFNQLASATGRLGNRPKAEELFRLQLDVARAAGMPLDVGLAQQNLAYNLNNQRRHEEAMVLLDSSVEIYERLPLPSRLRHALTTRSRTCVALGRLEKAVADAARAYELAVQLDTPDYLRDSAEHVAAAAAAAGDHAKAYEFARIASAAQTRAERERFDVRVAELQQRYESERRQREIDDLSRRNREQREELTQRAVRQRLLVVLAGGGILTAVVTAGLLFRLRLAHRALVSTQAERLAHEKALIESETRFRQAFDHAGIGMGILRHTDAQWTRVNRAFCEMVGYSEDELTQMTTLEMTHVDDVPGVLAGAAEMVAGNATVMQIDKRYRHKDGRFLWVCSTSSLVRDTAGRPLYAIVQVENIDARRQAEVALRESQARMTTIFETMSEGLALFNAEGRVIECNTAMPRLFGLSREQFGGRDFWEDGGPEGPRIFDVAGYPHLRRDNPALVVLRTGEAYRGLVYRIERPDGTTIWISTNCDPIRDARGAVCGVVVICADITERKTAEEQLRQSEERFRQAFEYSGVGVALVRLDGRWLRANAAVTAMLGWTEAELKETTFGALTHPDDLPLNLSEARRLQAGETSHMQVEKRYRHRDGHYVWGSVTVTIVRSPAGEPLYYVSQLQDVTGRKQLEEELLRTRDAAIKAARANAEFLANMSHEIRTPMNGVIGMADALAATSLDGSQQEMLRVVLQSAETLMTIIDDILDFSKIESGKLQIEQLAVNPQQLASDVVALFTPKAREKGLALTCASTAMPHLEVAGDPVRIRQVLSNLVGNAIKFTARGAVTVQVDIRSSGDGERLHFEVHDTGIGVSPTARDKLFRPFSQADRSHTRVYGGTGLGLAISRQLVELMNGEIGFSSAVNQGSTFWFWLPVRAAVAETAPGPEWPAKAGGATGGGGAGALHLLVVEDNDVNRQVIGRMLQREGHTAEFAEHGKSALELLAAAPSRFDAVLMDCQMPVMDGYETTRRIRGGAVCGLDRGIPIIALTANAMAADRERCLAAGMSDYVAKPVRLPALRQVLQQAVGAGSRVAPCDQAAEEE